MPKNKACKVMNSFVTCYNHVLINNEDALHHLQQKVESKLAEVNAANPKSSPIRCKRTDFSDGQMRIEGSIERAAFPEAVFFIDICQVKAVYVTDAPF
jgi:hypothetical protein